ncbi:MAG: hypothetical protein P8Y95_10890 [Gammaproteobacteria bacterium]
MKTNTYIDGPCYGELALIVLAGAGHVTAELTFSESTALIYSAGVAVAFLGYLFWRALRTEGVLRSWGMRRDNFWPALRAQLIFVIFGAMALTGIAAVMGSLALPSTFWLVLVLYPVWGIAQQFALQNLIARNLAGVLSSPLAIAVVASMLFGLSHFPRIDLMLLTLGAVVYFTLIYRRLPNLWAVGIAHGILGALAVYLVVDEDPGAALLALVFQR